MFPLQEIQAALRKFEIDGWLLFDFRGSNVLARRVMGMQSMPPTSRRFFYYIPAEGEPTKLVHRIENDSLDHLPGKKRVYLKWQELESGVAEIIGDDKTVAMEYSPEGGNPYVSRVDGGTI
ncbi:MAG: aminopeptidase P family protein, partial [bacterium]|nr:aminopeptidase P family protein [bacterium]